MKRAIYFLIAYKYDLLATAAIILTSFFSYFFRNDNRNIFVAAIIVSFFLLLLIIFLRVKERSFFFIPLTRGSDRENWFGDGIFEYSRIQKSFRITNSSAGFIFSKCLLWSDYSISFEFKILKSYLGVIARAINLSNYIMLQIGLDGIRPHIKINGGFKLWKHQDVGLSFNNKLSLEKWYKCFINCDKDIIKIKIIDKKELIIDREWRIRKGELGFSFPIKKAKLKDDDKGVEIVDGNTDKYLLVSYPITLEYGSIGFRNSSSEEALVKNVLIKKL